MNDVPPRPDAARRLDDNGEAAAPAGILEPSAASSQVWSAPEFMEELIPRNPEVVAELIQFYLEDTATGLNALREQLLRLDKPAAMRSLHGLKGSCRQIGGLRLGDLIEDLETRFQNNEVEDARQSLRLVETGFELLRLELQCRMTALEQHGARGTPDSARGTPDSARGTPDSARGTPDHVRTDS